MTTIKEALAGIETSLKDFRYEVRGDINEIKERLDRMNGKVDKVESFQDQQRGARSVLAGVAVLLGILASVTFGVLSFVKKIN
jgi:tetrahydromethanopterin S-methyltransferase subunit G